MASAQAIANTPASPLLATCSNADGSFLSLSPSAISALALTSIMISDD